MSQVKTIKESSAELKYLLRLNHLNMKKFLMMNLLNLLKQSNLMVLDKVKFQLQSLEKNMKVNVIKKLLVI